MNIYMSDVRFCVEMYSTEACYYHLKQIMTALWCLDHAKLHTNVTLGNL